MFLCFLIEQRTGIEDAFMKKKETTATHMKLKRQMCISLIDSPGSIADIKRLGRHIHFIAVICPLKRYTEERKRFLNEVVSCFDDVFFAKCIVILTQCSKEQTPNNIRREIKKVSEIDSNMKKILSNGYLVCPNADPNQDFELCREFRIQFVDKLFQTAFYSSIVLKSSAFCRPS